MQVLEYLQKKYKENKPTTILYSEAKIFGIPLPLESGWLKKYGGIEISQTMANRLIQSLRAKANNRFAADGLAVLEHETEFAINVCKKEKKRSKRKSENPVKNKKSKKTVTKKYVSGIDVSSDGFLSTYQWRSLRMVALKKYGAVCMCCGDSPKNGAVMNVDHIKPRKLFPDLALDIDNLQILCSPCNHGKGNWDFTDWRNKVNEIDLIDQENANHIKSILIDF